MWYKIKPLDTLFFRDGRPFSMGSETWANPIFPPYPSTIYGAIRSWLIFERGNLKEFKNGKYKEEIGTTNEKGKLKIKGPFISLKDNLYFPVPLDFLKKKDAKESEKSNLFYINFETTPEILISDYPLQNILINKGDFEVEECNEIFDINCLKNYLQYTGQKIDFKEKKGLIFYEKKTGITRSRKTLVSEEGHIYRIPMIRLKKNLSLCIEIEGLNSYPEGGLIQIGGEGKIAKIEKIKNADPLKILRNSNFKLIDKLFKIYLATPAIFTKGWLPHWINEENLEGEFNGIKLKLISCSIGKFNLIGGWDLANKKPKAMYKAVPAGSVYYFKILDDKTAEAIKETFHLKNISDKNPEEGFGLIFIGEVRK